MFFFVYLNFFIENHIKSMNENLYKWIYSLSSQIKCQQANQIFLENTSI